MTQVDRLQPTPLIQRILIFHLTLPEKCLEGKNLGEGASIQEISEQILYYHRDNRWQSGQDSDYCPPTPRTHLSLTEEAVQFLGLCTALYSLPSSFGDDARDDKTTEIHLAKSTLVFMPLESSKELLAVAQFSRLYQKGNRYESGGGNPLAVRSSIDRCHRMFCLLRGGGILRRLQRNVSSEAEEDNCSYPGMAKLYSLLKKLRYARQKLSDAGGSDKRLVGMNAINDGIDKLQREVKQVRKTLPIQSVRRDLDVHYKEFLGNMALVMSRNGGAGRCLVEAVPEPIPHVSKSCAFQSAPVDLSSISLPSTAQLTRQLITETHKHDNTHQLLGVSTFFQGHLLHSTMADEVVIRRLPIGRDPALDVAAPQESVCLAMGYMASYRMKMGQTSLSSQPEHDTISQPPTGGIRATVLSLGENAESSTGAQDSQTATQDGHPGGSFVPPPPMFMMNAHENASTLNSDKRKVWAPRICIPIVVSSGGLRESFTLDTCALMFEHGDFSFLIFVDPMVVNESHQVIEEFLCLLDSRLSETVLISRQTASSADPEEQFDAPGGPGQDIVLVKRAQCELVLFPDQKRIPSIGDKSATARSSTQRRFLGFGPRKQGNNKQQTGNTNVPGKDWMALGLDCRHLLASHLQLDIVLAFDDMMNEVASLWSSRRGSQEQNENDTLPNISGPLELCTCMSLGWIYAYARGDVELYAFFDSNIYVTVADVQKAARKITTLFQGELGAQTQ